MAGEHRLSGRDLETMTAVCAVCGPVRVASRGRGRWVCANRKAEREASRSPRRRQAGGRRSRHRLGVVEAGVATCATCGPVRAVPYGTGFACENTPGVRAGAARQGEPAATCPAHTVPADREVTHPDGSVTVVRKWIQYLRRDGSCARCLLDSGVPFEQVFPGKARSARMAAEEAAWLNSVFGLDDEVDTQPAYRGGYLTTDGLDPATPEYDSRVYGWRTLGEGSASDWWRKNGHLVNGGAA